jgi:dolichol-phosphate mannosyltransferase
MSIIAVTLPTLNEADNIGLLIREIRALSKDIHIVVADDDSPDGTPKIVEEIRRLDPKVHLLLRKVDKGRGRAGVDAFRYALQLGAEYIVEMDADFSHDPKYIPRLLAQMESADVAIGSRFAKGGRESGRGTLRKRLTSLSCAYGRLMLGVPIQDMNSGFRCFRRELLQKIEWHRFLSTGPSIVQELNYRCFLQGARFVEVPITFHQRQRGRSKLSVTRLLQTALMILKLRYLESSGLL